MYDIKEYSSLVQYKNRLNDAVCDLSSYEWKILDAAIKKVTPASLPSTLFLVTPKDLQLSGISNSNANKALKNAVLGFFAKEKLVSLPVKAVCDDGIDILKDIISSGNENIIFSWFDCIILTDEGILIRFHRYLFPYLKNLTEQFTLYRPEEIADLNSRHAIRLYKKLHQWKNNHELVKNINGTFSKTKYGVYRVSFNELRTQMKINNELYSNFKKNCLIIARKQINTSTHASLSFDFLEHKTGKQITELEFRIYNKSSVNSTISGEGILLDNLDFSISDSQAKALAYKVLGLDETAYKRFKGIHKNFDTTTFIQWCSDHLGTQYAETFKAMSPQELIETTANLIKNESRAKKMYADWLRPLGYKPKQTKSKH